MTYFILGVLLWVGTTVAICVLPPRDQDTGKTHKWRWGYAIFASVMGGVMGLGIGLPIGLIDGQWMWMAILPFMFGTTFAAVAWFRPSIL